MSQSSEDWVSISEVDEAFVDKPSEVSGLKSGYDTFDRLTAGMERGKLGLVVSNPAMGVTSFSLNLVSNLLNMDRSVLYLTSQYTRDDILDRLLSIRGRLSYSNYQRGDRKEVSEARTQLVELKQRDLFIQHRDRLFPDPASLFSSQKLEDQNFQDLIVVDRMNHFVDVDHAEENVGQLRNQLREIRRKAETYECHVLLTLNMKKVVRGITQRPDYEAFTKLPAFQEYSSETQYVSTLLRPKLGEVPSRAELTIRRNRHGPTGTIDLEFDDCTLRFESFERGNGSRIVQGTQ